MTFSQETLKLVLFFILLFYSLYLFKNYFSLRREENRLGFLKLDIDIDKIDEEIEKFVEICLNEYIAYNPQLMQEVYINAALEREIVEGVTKLCVERISPVMLDRFSLCYNLTDIGNVIGRKVYMRVLIYQIEHEQTKREEIEKSNRKIAELPESE